jgi:hypothetical protein
MSNEQDKKKFIKKINFLQNWLLDSLKDTSGHYDSSRYIFLESSNEAPKNVFLSFFYMRRLENGTTFRDSLLRLIEDHQADLQIKKPLPSLVELDSFLKSLDIAKHKVPIHLVGQEPKALWNNTINDIVKGFKNSSTQAKTKITKCLKDAINEIKYGVKASPIIEEIEASNKTYDDLLEIFHYPSQGGNIFIFMNDQIPTTKKTYFLRHAYIAVKLIEKAHPILANAITSMYEMTFFVGPRNVLDKFAGEDINSDYGAFYDLQKDAICIPTTLKGDYITRNPNEQLFASIVHEFGHRLHFIFMKDRYRNRSIIQLYNQAMQATDRCFLEHLPKIGDPFSNLREEWHTVRKNPTDDYFLTDIQGTVYVYTNSKDEKMLVDKKVILMRITCPSEYGAKNEREFFAEMFSLIVLEMVKPSQQVVVNKFLDIVAKESI